MLLSLRRDTMALMPQPITAPDIPDFDYSAYDQAFLAAEAGLAERPLQDESDAGLLTPADLRARANRLSSSAEVGGGLED